MRIRTALARFVAGRDYHFVERLRWQEKCHQANDGHNLRNFKLPKLQTARQKQHGLLMAIKHELGHEAEPGFSLVASIRALKEAKEERGMVIQGLLDVLHGKLHPAELAEGGQGPAQLEIGQDTAETQSGREGEIS